MAEMAPLSALVKKRPGETAKEPPRWVPSRQVVPDSLPEAPAVWRGIGLDAIAEALSRKAHPRIVAQCLCAEASRLFPEEAFCLIDLHAPAPQRLLAQEGLHAELRLALNEESAKTLFPCLFSGSDEIIADARAVGLPPAALDLLEMIRSCWTWSTRSAPCVTFAVFSSEACAPTPEQLDSGLAIMELSDKLFCKYGREQLADELAAESQGRQTSPGSALLHLLSRG